MAKTDSTTRTARAKTATSPSDADNKARIAGALACLEALRKLDKAAEASLANCYDTAEECMYQQLNDAQALVAAFGPMTPRQEGAMLTLAEWIHKCITCGEMDFSYWLPVAAMTKSERQRRIDRANADQAADDEMEAQRERELMSNVIQFPQAST